MEGRGLPQDDECLLLVARGPQPAGIVEGGIRTARVLGVGLAPVLDTALGAGLGARLGIGARQQPPIGVGEGGSGEPAQAASKAALASPAIPTLAKRFSAAVGLEEFDVMRVASLAGAPIRAHGFNVPAGRQQFLKPSGARPAWRNPRSSHRRLRAVRPPASGPCPAGRGWPQRRPAPSHHHRRVQDRADRSGSAWQRARTWRQLP